MTFFGGTTKQRRIAFAAVAFFVLAISCAVGGMASTEPALLRSLSLFGFVMGIICVAGVWAAGLPKAQNPNS